MSSKIPKKFLESKKSFMEKLAPAAGLNEFGSFCAFPEGVRFQGQDKDEHVVLVIRQHPAKFVVQYLIILGLLIMPLLVLGLVNTVAELGFLFGLGVMITCLLIAIAVAVDTFLKWYYSVNIITDQRIVDVDFSNILFHKFSEAQLEKIEDVSHSTTGILSSLFDYGDVYIQTAGTKPEFEFIGVPRPRDIQDVLLDLLEMKTKGKI